MLWDGLESDYTNAPVYAAVAIPLPVTRTYTYILAPNIRSRASVGARVIVPFGRQTVTGYIVSLLYSLEPSSDLRESDMKETIELVDSEPLLTPEVIEITSWISDYYVTPWGEVLKAALPSGLNAVVDKIVNVTPKGFNVLKSISSHDKQSPSVQLLLLIASNDNLTLQQLVLLVRSRQAIRLIGELEQLGHIKISPQKRIASAREKRQKAVRLAPQGDQKDGVSNAKLTSIQARIVETIKREGPDLSLVELLDIAQVGPSPVRTLEKRGVIEVFDRNVRRDPLAGSINSNIDDVVLTDQQRIALVVIENAIRAGSYSTFLLHGVTGSGKTEIYIRAMKATLQLGKSAMMLVPEISLTPAFSRGLRARFGDDVAVLHSSLSTGERFDEWSRIKNGEARIVIGTRSAVFAPISTLGLVVVDEEHEASYRQQESPIYHGRDTAIVRAVNEAAVVILGSATPSLESFHNAKRGKYSYLQLSDRIASRGMPKAELIDMREVFARHGNNEVFSPRLLEAINTTHSRGEQSIILLNRRGFSSIVLCRSCGESIHCPNCDVTLTFHKRDAALVCHYCNHRMRAPNQCPACKGNFIYYVGEGTEQIEALLKTQFPELRIARLDRDTTRRRKQFEKTLIDFGTGELDMLVGTQMLAKGHDFPNVTLVGVISVDAGLSMPDFRSAERTFQLITQVAGRAGRGEREGHVLIQTYHPDHYALRHACAQDYAGFYEEEIRYRRSINYPPFMALASLIIHGKDFTHVFETAEEVKNHLLAANKERDCRILGPAPAPLSRLKGEHRRHVLIKSHSRSRMREVIDYALTAAAAQQCDINSVTVEIDPVNLM